MTTGRSGCALPSRRIAFTRSRGNILDRSPPNAGSISGYDDVLSNIHERRLQFAAIQPPLGCSLCPFGLHHDRALPNCHAISVH
jgi:hypothetical protein